MDYLDIFRESRAQLQRRLQAAIEWYRNKTSGIFTRQTANQEPQQPQQQSFRSYPSNVAHHGGDLFLFDYNAKWGHKLPYWDRKPLIIPLGPSERHLGNFLGLNFHYLPPQQRAALFNGMRSQLQTGVFPRHYRIMASYEKLVANPGIFPGYEKCIKEYIPNRISSGERIDPRDWEHVIMLPVRPDTGPNWVINQGFSAPY